MCLFLVRIRYCQTARIWIKRSHVHLAVRYDPDTKYKSAMHGVSVHAHMDACRRHASADTILLIAIQILQTNRIKKKLFELLQTVTFSDLQMSHNTTSLHLCHISQPYWQ